MLKHAWVVIGVKEGCKDAFPHNINLDWVFTSEEEARDHASHLNDNQPARGEGNRSAYKVYPTLLYTHKVR